MTFDENTRGLFVAIYKPADGGDHTNRGVTSKATEALLIGEAVSGPFTVAGARGRGYPVLRLVRREFRGEAFLLAVPAEAEGDGIGRYMFGGNFVYTSDARLGEAWRHHGAGAFPYPVPVHDRTEAVSHGG